MYFSFQQNMAWNSKYIPERMLFPHNYYAVLIYSIQLSFLQHRNPTLANLLTQNMPRCLLCTVSLFIIVMMEDDSELANSWFQIGFLNNLFLGSLMLLRNGSVLGTNIWILIFKWIRSKNSRVLIKWAVAFTNLPFFWETLYSFRW